MVGLSMVLRRESKKMCSGLREVHEQTCLKHFCCILGLFRSQNPNRSRELAYQERLLETSTYPSASSGLSKLPNDLIQKFISLYGFRGLPWDLIPQQVR